MLGGKDWDKYLTCEGCRKRPTMCECSSNNRRMNISFIKTVISLITIITIGFYILYYFNK